METHMLHWSLVFLVLFLVSLVTGRGGLMRSPPASLHDDSSVRNRGTPASQRRLRRRWRH